MSVLVYALGATFSLYVMVALALAQHYMWAGLVFGLYLYTLYALVGALARRDSR